MNAGDPAVLFNKASSPSNTSATPKSAICYYKNILLILLFLFNPFTPELLVQTSVPCTACTACNVCSLSGHTRHIRHLTCEDLRGIFQQYPRT